MWRTPICWVGRPPGIGWRWARWGAQLGNKWGCKRMRTARAVHACPSPPRGLQDQTSSPRRNTFPSFCHQHGPRAQYKLPWGGEPSHNFVTGRVLPAATGDAHLPHQVQHKQTHLGTNQGLCKPTNENTRWEFELNLTSINVVRPGSHSCLWGVWLAPPSDYTYLHWITAWGRGEGSITGDWLLI